MRVTGEGTEGYLSVFTDQTVVGDAIVRQCAGGTGDFAALANIKGMAQYDSYTEPRANGYSVRCIKH